MKNVIERGWDAILDELKASDGDIERGLELHRKSIVCDTCGGSGRPWSKRMTQKVDKVIRDGNSPEMIRE